MRHLTAGEIAGQVRVLAAATGLLDKPFNIVLMGMGEPLHNYDNTMKALRILHEEHGLAVSPRRVTLSTVGIVPALERLANEAADAEPRDLAPRDDRGAAHASWCRRTGSTRSQSLIEACRAFPLKKRSRITFEYVMLAGVNDSLEDARRLARLLAGIKSKVNLIPLNAAPGIPFERPARRPRRCVRADPGRSPHHGVGAKEPWT